ncbi:MAG: hypothetical protein ABI813_16140 [Bacteroidota bacterium]
MKAYFTAALTVSLLTSCSKNSIPRQQITGQWELRKEVGGLAGLIQYEPGTGRTLKFGDDKTFQANYPNGPDQVGTYEIVPSANPGYWILNTHFLANGQPSDSRDSIRFEKNQLIILPFASCCDIPTDYYDRLH